MPTTYILVDFENVQPEDLAPLQGGTYQLRVFLGSQQTKLPRKLVIGMQQLAAENPGSAFKVVSGDTGFDALIERMNKQGISCARLQSLTQLAMPADAAVPACPETLSVVIDLLSGMRDAKPRSMKTLRSTIRKKLGTGFPEADLGPLLAALQARSFLVVDKARVCYASDVGVGEAGDATRRQRVASPLTLNL